MEETHIFTYTVMVGSRKVFEGIGKKEAGRIASVYMMSDNVLFGVSISREAQATV